MAARGAGAQEAGAAAGSSFFPPKILTAEVMATAQPPSTTNTMSAGRPGFAARSVHWH